jgi:hypothetical protein
MSGHRAKRPAIGKNAAAAICDGQPFAIGGKLKSSNLAVVRPEFATLTRSHVPHLHTSIIGLGRITRSDYGKPQTIGRERNRRPLAGIEVTPSRIGEGQDRLKGPQLAHLQDMIPFRRDHPDRLRRKRHDFAGAGYRFQRFTISRIINCNRIVAFAGNKELSVG